jgi:glutamate/tyrosine decarboxylase-like PLP-dependent enzyme
VDSVTFDFHKLLGGTLTKAIFITQKEGLLTKANSCAGTQYIFHEDDDSFFDTGTKAIQCGRKVDALSLWMTWKFLGHKGYKAYVDDLMNLRGHVQHLIEKYNYKLIHTPEYLNICFQIPLMGQTEAENSPQVNDFQKQIRRQLVKEGLVLVNYSSTEQHGVFFRLVLNHLRLNEKVLDRIFEIINETKGTIFPDDTRSVTL